MACKASTCEEQRILKDLLSTLPAAAIELYLIPHTDVKMHFGETSFV